MGGFDAVTFGTVLSDEDKIGVALAYGVDPSSPYFLAGQIVGNLTVTAAVTIASGGLGGASCVGRAATAARVIGKTMQGIMAVVDVYKVGSASLEYAQTGEWSAAQTEAAVTVGLHVLGIGIGRVFKPKCFVAGTQVLAQDEQGNTVSRNIEDVQAGDMVWSLDEHTGKPGFKPVVETYVRETDTLVHMSYRREARSRVQGEKGGDAEDGDGLATLVGTAEHPFWSLTRNKWVNMGDLAVGELLRLNNGTAIVTAVRTEVLAAPVKVYNFQVADHHTYFAAPGKGKAFVWVHNANYRLSQEVRALAEAHVSTKGTTVLGHFPEYLQKARRTGASYFDLGKTWKLLSPSRRTAANLHFLDVIARRGDTVLLSVAKQRVRQGSALATELEYLVKEKDYRWVNQWALRPK